MGDAEEIGNGINPEVIKFMSKDLEVTGETVADAIEKGLNCLKIEKNQVDIEIIDEGKSGLFGLMGSTPAKIRITVKDGYDAGVAACATGMQSVIKEAEDTLNNILKLAGFKAELTSEPTPGGFVINAKTSDGALLIGKNGQTMSAFEYILKLIIRKRGNRDIRIALNIDGYLEKKTEKLAEKARELATEVRMKGEPISICLPADERRIIHITLKDESDIETVSEGDGADRKILIRPKTSAPV